LHIVAFDSWRHVWRFSRAKAVEPLEPSTIESVNFGVRKTPIYEAWCDLGEKLFGYDETVARQAALASPVHAMIVSQRVENILRKAPPRFRSTRFVVAILRVRGRSVVGWRRRSGGQHAAACRGRSIVHTGTVEGREDLFGKGPAMAIEPKRHEPDIPQQKPDIQPEPTPQEIPQNKDVPEKQTPPMQL
jgi:hypothetical protein